jgi:hypothetical protein
MTLPFLIADSKHRNKAKPIYPVVPVLPCVGGSPRRSLCCPHPWCSPASRLQDNRSCRIQEEILKEITMDTKLKQQSDKRTTSDTVESLLEYILQSLNKNDGLSEERNIEKKETISFEQAK